MNPILASDIHNTEPYWYTDLYGNIVTNNIDQVMLLCCCFFVAAIREGNRTRTYIYFIPFLCKMLWLLPLCNLLQLSLWLRHRFPLPFCHLSHLPPERERRNKLGFGGATSWTSLIRNPQVLPFPWKALGPRAIMVYPGESDVTCCPTPRGCDIMTSHGIMISLLVSSWR